MTTLVALILGAFLFVDLPMPTRAQNPSPTLTEATAIQWSGAVNLSSFLSGAWFPSLAVDHRGNVYVAFSQTTPPSAELLYLTKWDGQAWTRPSDIADGRGFIVRSAIAADNAGYLQMIYGIHATAVHSFARLDEANQARGWSKPRPFTRDQEGYLGEIEVDRRGTIHLLYNEATASCPGDCFRIHYRQSGDGGITWSEDVVLASNYTSRNRLDLVVDDDTNRIYVVWDNLTPQAEPRSGGFAYSEDGGLSWNRSGEIVSVRGTPAYLTLAKDRKGNLVLVYRLDRSNEIDYQISSDGGRTWGPAAQIPGIFQGDPKTNFDKYSMAWDSAGTVYLAVAGRTNASQPGAGLYVLTWDGETWSAPIQLMPPGSRFAEYPTIKVSEGNQLHLVWHVRGRNSIFALPDNTYQVFYVRGQSSAPPQTPIPIPTLPPTPTATYTPIPARATPTATRTPLPSVEGPLEPVQPWPQLPILLALVPVLLIILGLVVWRVLVYRR